MNRVLSAVVVVLICACGMTGSSTDQNGFNQYPNQDTRQQRPLDGDNRQSSTKPHGTFKIDSVEKTFSEDDNKVCRYEKTGDTVFIGVRFESSDARSSMELSLSGLEKSNVFHEWKGFKNETRKVTLENNSRDSRSRYTNQVTDSASECKVLYNVDGKLLNIRYFECTKLRNGTSEYLGSGEAACYIKSSDADKLR